MFATEDRRQVRDHNYETKFLVDRERAARIAAWAERNMQPDPQAREVYRVTSLYFDTEELAVYRRVGSFARSKYRVRRYGASELAYLERKLKNRGLVSKWRTVLPLEELARLAAAEAGGAWPGQWYHRRLLVRRLRPVCQVSYERLARVAEGPYGPLRLTLDDDLRAVRTGRLEFAGAGEAAPFTGGRMILELKYPGEMPALFRRLLEQMAMAPQRISKYRLATGFFLGETACRSF